MASSVHLTSSSKLKLNSTQGNLTCTKQRQHVTEAVLEQAHSKARGVAWERLDVSKAEHPQ